ncbi:MAG: hypothetical protein CL756_05050 [Chloroflexi bacterium]|nr:hypothetical protein [Chloroflexota bacterium]|tara:strand:+ start:2546 stop:3034 length:489 start_codon:yes stop_codon:yes gene_type:complete
MKKIGFQKTLDLTQFNQDLACSPVTAEIDSSNLFGVAKTQVEPKKLGVMVMLEKIIEIQKRSEIPTHILEELISISTTLEDLQNYLDDYLTLELITMQDASEEFNIPYNTITSWVTQGKLKKYAYTPAQYKVGRPFVLISLEELKDLINNPPKMGRPRKIIS